MPAHKRTVAEVQEHLINNSAVDENGCWIWKGGQGGEGYGIMFASVLSDTPIRTHVASWRVFRGGIEKGFHVHHTCHSTLCLNPDHLQVISAADHLRLHRPPIDPDVCMRGHRGRFGSKTNGGRWCLECDMERNRRNRARLRNIR